MKETRNMMNWRKDEWIWGDLVKLILAEMLDQTDEELNEITNLEQELKNRVHYFAAQRFLTNIYVQKKFQDIAKKYVHTLQDSQDVYSESRISILEWPLQAKGPIINIGGFMQRVIIGKAVKWWYKYLEKGSITFEEERHENLVEEENEEIDLPEIDLNHLLGFIKEKRGSPDYEIFLYRSELKDYNEIVMLLPKINEERVALGEKEIELPTNAGAVRVKYLRLKTWLRANYLK